MYRSARSNESADWFDSDLYAARKLISDVDNSGLIVQKKIIRSEDKQQTSFVKPLESYQLSSKELAKSYIKHKTTLNTEKYKLLLEYLQFAQRIDGIFSEMKDLGNDNMQDQIIDTIVKSKDQNTDLSRKLLDLQTELLMTQAMIDQDKEVLVSGTKYSLQKAMELEKKRERVYKDEKKNDKVMTL